MPSKAEHSDVHAPISIVSGTSEGHRSTKPVPCGSNLSANFNSRKKSYNNLRKLSCLTMNPSCQSEESSSLNTRQDSIATWYSLPDDDTTAYITPMSSPRSEHFSDCRLSLPRYSDSETTDEQSLYFSDNSEDGDYYDAPIVTKKPSKPAIEDSGLCLLDWSESADGSPKGQIMDQDPLSPSLPPLILRKGSKNTRIPSLRVRSRSVPAPFESAAISELRESTSVDRISTWGLGSKGVSEDWDEDFDFDGSDDDDIDDCGHEFIPLQQLRISDDSNIHAASTCHNQPPTTNNIMSTTQKGSLEMKIPEEILKRQESVHVQYGHVQELTRLVDELKSLLAHGEALHIGMASEKWKEAKGIINLANSEDADDNTGSVICDDDDDDSSDNEYKELVQDIVASSTSATQSSTLAVAPPPTFASCLPPFAPKISQLSRDNLKSRPSMPTLSQVSVEAAFSCPTTLPDKPTSSSAPSSPSPLCSSQFDDCLELSSYAKSMDLPNDCNERCKLSFDSHSLKTLVSRADSVAQSLREIIHQAAGSTSQGDFEDALLPHFGVNRQPNRPDVREVFNDVGCEDLTVIPALDITRPGCLP